MVSNEGKTLLSGMNSILDTGGHKQVISSFKIMEYRSIDEAVSSNPMIVEPVLFSTNK